jgi:hypothetical protein
MHPSELARAVRELHADPSVPGEQRVRAGTAAEEAALYSIDRAREEELRELGSTPASRRRDFARRLRREGLRPEEIGR